MKTIVDNLAVEYMDEGSGAVVLMLHGWGNNLHSFDGLIKKLDDRRIIRLDLPGFGGSELPKNAWAISDYALFVKAFIEKISISPDVIVGHSMGGRVAIEGTARGLFAPRKLVLIASAGGAQRKNVRNYLYLVVAKIGKIITSVPPLRYWRASMRKRLYAAAESDYYDAGPLRETFKKTVNEDITPIAQTLAIPALLIWGAEDTTTPISQGQKLHGAIENSKLEILDNCDHFVHQQQPEEVVRLIKDFI